MGTSRGSTTSSPRHGNSEAKLARVPRGHSKHCSPRTRLEPSWYTGKPSVREAVDSAAMVIVERCVD